VGATLIFTASVMPHVYMKLRRNHPTIDLRVVDLPKPEVERLVRNGDLDCGLGIFVKRVPEVAQRPLFSFDFLYLESTRMPFLFKGRRPAKEVDWSELPDVPFVELPVASELQHAIAKRRAAAGTKRRDDGISFNNLESLIGMAAAGVGPTILPSFAMPVRHPDFASALLTGPVLSMDFHMISKRGRSQPAVLEAFASTLREVIAERGERVY
jgi:DNA-binding transcriptional LysR family regulator